MNVKKNRHEKPNTDSTKMCQKPTVGDKVYIKEFTIRNKPKINFMFSTKSANLFKTSLSYRTLKPNKIQKLISTEFIFRNVISVSSYS